METHDARLTNPQKVVVVDRYSCRTQPDELMLEKRTEAALASREGPSIDLPQHAAAERPALAKRIPDDDSSARHTAELTNERRQSIVGKMVGDGDTDCVVECLVAEREARSVRNHCRRARPLLSSRASLASSLSSQTQVVSAGRYAARFPVPPPTSSSTRPDVSPRASRSICAARS